MGILKNIFVNFLGNLAHQYAFNKAKQKMILVYLKTLQAMRRSLIVAILVFLTLQLMIFGFLGLGVTSIWLLPTEDFNTKLFILLGFFGFLFFVPAICLCVIFSERFWFRNSGAEQLLKET